MGLNAILCCLMISSCVNGQEAKADSYELVDVQHFDCNVYMMIFKTTSNNGCSFRMSQSGPCDSLSMDQFLKYYGSFLEKNKGNILRSRKDCFVFDCYGKIDLSKQANINRVLAVTRKELKIKVGFKEKSEDGVVIEVQ